jgi:hypothetical protein
MDTVISVTLTTYISKRHFNIMLALSLVSQQSLPSWVSVTNDTAKKELNGIKMTYLILEGCS